MARKRATIKAVSAMLGKNDPVDHPNHYMWIPGIEAIQICEHLPFCMGAAVKYIIRADHKGNPIEDIRKAIWNLRRELKRRATKLPKDQ